MQPGRWSEVAWICEPGCQVAVPDLAGDKKNRFEPGDAMTLDVAFSIAVGGGPIDGEQDPVCSALLMRYNSRRMMNSRWWSYCPGATK